MNPLAHPASQARIMVHDLDTACVRIWPALVLTCLPPAFHLGRNPMQSMLDRNKLLIAEINKNQELRDPGA